MTYPSIRVGGTPYERGHGYGRQARERILLSIRSYAAYVESHLDMDWSDAVRGAQRFRAIVEDSTPYMEEIAGIAAGAGVAEGEILALNARTEIVTAALIGSPRWPARADGCTAMAALGAASRDGATVLAQNWDWMAHTTGTVVVLEVQREDGPSYATVVEAGLLAKAGMNSAGLGICTNFLITEQDGGNDGLPYHLTLRAALDAETLPELLEGLIRVRRASSANYLVAHADGAAIDIEVTPGGVEGVAVRPPADDLLVHANHFCSPVSGDVSVAATPDSPFRQARLESLLRARHGAIDVPLVQELLADHASFPRSICAHADLRHEPADRETTAYGIVMDVVGRRMFLTDGNPCAAPWRELPLGDLLEDARPSRQERAPALLG